MPKSSGFRPESPPNDGRQTGQVVITERAIADVVGLTVLECYGVVGMASPGLYRGVARLLTRDKLHQGIRVDSSKDQLKIELYLIVEYGLNVAEVAGNVRSQVAYSVERATRLRVTDLQVHIQGVRVGDE
ncbi:MAG: Asp23/Gls24 family envelope stress response protein [Actinobacteria bacterium]|nr:Asp23/Gls24 family envelope stress response protein [Actinomycetota bacterium]